MTKAVAAAVVEAMAIEAVLVIRRRRKKKRQRHRYFSDSNETINCAHFI